VDVVHIAVAVVVDVVARDLIGVDPDIGRQVFVVQVESIVRHCDNDASAERNVPGIVVLHQCMVVLLDVPRVIGNQLARVLALIDEIRRRPQYIRRSGQLLDGCRHVGAGAESQPDDAHQAAVGIPRFQYRLARRAKRVRKSSEGPGP